MVRAKIEADKIFDTKYKPIIDIKVKKIPKYNAWLFEILPRGIGLKHVRDIIASISESYHMFNAPAAPAPAATKNKAKTELARSIWFFEITNPTRAVNITRDITLGFIKL